MSEHQSFPFRPLTRCEYREWLERYVRQAVIRATFEGKLPLTYVCPKRLARLGRLNQEIA